MPPRRPKRKIEKATIMSSVDVNDNTTSGTDSDDTVIPARMRRKRARVNVNSCENLLSEEVSDVGDGAETASLELRDLDVDSDTSGSATDHSYSPKIPPAATKSTLECNSHCSICLHRFTDQVVGTPQSCNHVFCLDCIKEWTKRVNTCPIDRKKVNFIVVRACIGGRELRKESVKEKQRRSVCHICESAGSADTMLLCYVCDLGYHLQCLTRLSAGSPGDNPTAEVTDRVTDRLCPNCCDLLVEMPSV